MQTQKMSLANIKGKLSRAEMKNIMAGSGSSGQCGSSCSGSCKIKGGPCDGVTGVCGSNSNGCFCSGAC